MNTIIRKAKTGKVVGNVVAQVDFVVEAKGQILYHNNQRFDTAVGFFRRRRYENVKETT